MSDLVRYELKKIAINRAGMIACAIALLIINGITVLDVTTTQTFDYNGKTCSGMAALTAYRERQESHAGVLDAERVARDLAKYDRAKTLADGKELAFSNMAREEVLDAYGLEFWRSTYAVLKDAYYTRLHDVMAAGNDSYASDLRQAIASRVDQTLGEGFLKQHAYVSSEKDLWHEKASAVSWSIEYGYADGWVTALNWTSFLPLAIVALCVALCGVFSGEYHSHSVDVVVPTKRGKRELPAAKLVASLIFVTAYWWSCVALMLGVIFAFFGTEGANLPIQVMGFSNPYPLTMAGAMGLRCVLGYVLALGMSGLTLWLSARTRSSMLTAAIPMAITLLGLVGLFVTPISKVAALTPFGVLTWSYTNMVSYGLGPVAVDLPLAAAILYAVVFALSLVKSRWSTPYA